MNRNDILWKSILEDIFDDFLRFFYPDADQLFDFSKAFVYLDKELEQLFPPDDGQYEPRYVDKLVKVFTRDGNEEWVLVHIEVQGYRDKLFADRMFTYYYRIWDKYRKRTTAFAILTDASQSFYPDKFEQSFLGTKLRFEFNSIKIRDYPDVCLVESDNPFAQVVLTVKTALKGKKLRERDLFTLKMQLARRLLSSKVSKYKIGKLLDFLKLYVRIGNTELNNQFDTEIVTLKQSTTMGMDEAVIYITREEALEEGLEKGLEKGRLERNLVLVKNLLKETSFSIEQIARLVDVSIEFVQEVKSNF